MNEFEIQKKALKGILTKEDINNCTEDVLRKALLIISSTTAIHKISKEDLTKKVCKDKCYLYNTEYCKPDGLALYDTTTCKSFHTEESFKAMNKCL
jgi:hypothetical protein